MYFDDHGPPHFHAYYEKDSATIDIDTQKILSGKLPKRATTLVKKWAEIHHGDLAENWRLAEIHEALLPIEPLE